MVACELSQRHPTEALRCPRCDSSDTKFCYFNNYNTSQPRHFCKSCKRYWTAGGSLRNVPVGGGLRKNKKSKLLNQVRDLVSSSSSDELLQSSLAANASFAVTNKVLQYDSSIPLSFASPLLMTAPSSSPDFARDGTLGNPYAFRSLNTANYGFFADNRMDDFATPVDPSLVNSISARPQPHSQADYVRTLPEALQRQWHGGSHVSLASIVADQAQSYSGCISEVPSEASQASFEMMKDAHASKSTDLHACQLDQIEATEEKSNKMCRDECLDAIVVIGQEHVGEHCNGVKQEKVIEESVRTEDNQLRDVSSTEEDDDLGNVVNVRYPYDWDQVSEVLFGGATDFFQLSGY